MLSRFWPITAVGAFTTLAQGQVTLDYHFTTTEVYAGTTTPVANPNGLIEPGEGVLFQLTVNFAPPVGSVLPGFPPPATVAGLGGFYFHFVPRDGSGDGMWSHFALAPGWLGANGGPIGGGVLNSAWLEQVPMLGQPADPRNPLVNGWSQVWTPASYEPRTVNWEAQPGSFIGWGFVLVQVGTDPQGGPIYNAANASFAPIRSFPVSIVPAPGAAVVLVVGMMLMPRRRSRAVGVG
jgi:hypothetical protein